MHNFLQKLKKVVRTVLYGPVGLLASQTAGKPISISVVM